MLTTRDIIILSTSIIIDFIMIVIFCYVPLIAHDPEIGASRPARTHAVLAVDINPRGDLVAACDVYPTLTVWNYRKNTMYNLSGFSNSPIAIAFNPDCIEMASSGYGEVAVWNADSGAHIWSINHDKRFPFTAAIRYFENGAYIASSCGNEVVIIDRQKMEIARRFTFENDPIRSIDITRDGRLIAVLLLSGDVRVIDSVAGTTIFLIRHHHVRSLSWSDDGFMLACGTNEHDVKLFLSHTGKHLATLSGHRDAVSCVCFSRGGESLASGGSDNEIIIWEMPSGQLLHRLIGHGREVNSIVFSPDGSVLVSGSSDQTVRIWDVATGQTTNVLHGVDPRE